MRSPALESPLVAAYDACCDLIIQLRASLGPNHFSVKPLQLNELAHLKSHFVATNLKRDDCKALMAKIDGDNRGCFTADQVKAILDLSCSRIEWIHN